MMFQSSGREESWEQSFSGFHWSCDARVNRWESLELWVRSTHSEHSLNWDRHDNRSRNRTDQFEFCSHAEWEWRDTPLSLSVPLRSGDFISHHSNCYWSFTDSSIFILQLSLMSSISILSSVRLSWQTLAAFNGLCVYSQTRLIAL